MSSVQVEALRIVMLVEDHEERTKRIETLKLGWLGHEYENIQRAFPEYFGPLADINITKSSTTDDIDRAIEAELEGDSSEWTLERPEGVDPEEVTRLLQKMMQGTATLPTESDWQ